MYPQPPPYGMGGPMQPPAPPPVAVPQSGSGSGGSSSLDSSVIGLLRNMEREDLQRLDERAIDSLIADDSDLNKMLEQKATETASNRSLAEHNLSYQAKLERGRRALTDVHKEAAELARVHRELRDRVARGERGESLENLHTLLQSACLEAEETAEAHLESLLSSRLDLAEFVSLYTDARSLYHTRRVKADKVTEISNQRIVQVAPAVVSSSQHQQQHQQSPAYRQPPAPPPPPSGPAYGMPSYYYPTPPYQQQPPYGGRP